MPKKIEILENKVKEQNKLIKVMKWALDDLLLSKAEYKRDDFVEFYNYKKLCGIISYIYIDNRMCLMYRIIDSKKVTHIVYECAIKKIIKK